MLKIASFTLLITAIKIKSQEIKQRSCISYMFIPILHRKITPQQRSYTEPFTAMLCS